MTEWIETRDRLPVDGAEVETMNSVGDVSNLVYSSRMWWLPDMSMYVYYVPQRWRPASMSADVREAVSAAFTSDPKAPSARKRLQRLLRETDPDPTAVQDHDQADSNPSAGRRRTP